MGSVDEFLAAAEDSHGPKRDGYGRYLLPRPKTGKERAYTRVTTLASSLADTYGLSLWQRRKVAEGLALRSDLLAAVASLVGTDDTKALDRVLDGAMEHAGSSTGARLGTALHLFTERIDRGESPKVPEPWDADVACYLKTLPEAGVEIIGEYIERIVVNEVADVAGTLDRLVRLPDGRLVVADLKTGADLKYKWPEIAIQLACYAHAEWMVEGTGYRPMPEVDRNVALVIHLPVTKATCTLWLVDIAAGWTATALARQVRDWRKRRDLVTQLEAAPATPPPVVDDEPVDRAQWITSRLATLAASERARTLVAGMWPEGVTLRPPWPGQAIEALSAMLDTVEAQVQAPFGNPDPATPPAENLERQDPEQIDRAPTWTVADDGAPASREDVDGLRGVLARLDESTLTTLHRWAKEGVRHDRRWDQTASMTQRQWLVARAAISCATHLRTDEAVLAALAVYALPEPPPRTWEVGAVLGALTAGQAERLADAADSYGSRVESYVRSVEGTAADLYAPF